MRELLLESKGCLTRRGIFSIVVGVICFVVGLWIAVQSTEVGGYRLSTRLFGGGLTVRNTEMELLIIGFVFLFVGALLLDMAIGERRSWVRVYSYHVEGQPVRLGIRTLTFSLPLQEISSVSMDQQRGMVVFHSRGSSYKVVCPRYRDAFHMVDRLISDRSQEKMPRMRRCISCGRILEENAAFCPSCGTRNEGRK